MDRSLYERDENALSKLQKLRFFPLAVTGGEGAYLHAEDGRRLLDLSASWGAASLGHAHPALKEAVASAIDTQAGASLLSTANEPAILLAERLLDIVPGEADRRVWLGHSGSDANETVARAVVAATGRRRILSFSGAYHGGTAGSMAVSGHSVQEHAERSDGLQLVPYPDAYRAQDGADAGEAVLAQLEEMFAITCPPSEVAAFFIEPIQSDGGLLVPPAGFLRSLNALCQRHGILTVCDEVKVGLGRSGRLHCFEHDGWTPDIVVLGKGLGGGLPISAAIGPARVMNHATAFSMQTLHGNPVCTRAALTVLDIIERDGLVDNAADTGEHLMAGLKELQQSQDTVGDVRGHGLAIGVELVKDRVSKEPAAELAAMTVYRAFELGAVLYYVGMASNVLELTPALILDKAQADDAVRLISQAIEDAVAGKVPASKLTAFEGW